MREKGAPLKTGRFSSDAPSVTRVCTASLFSERNVRFCGDTLPPGLRLIWMPFALKASVKAITSASYWPWYWPPQKQSPLTNLMPQLLYRAATLS